MKRLAILTLVAATALGCRSRQVVGQPTLDAVPRAVRVTPHDKVDILFMIDDSLSMSPKQIELRHRFGNLMNDMLQLASSGLPASFHIGVVTSDLGAGPMPTGGCTPDGDGGRLQTMARSSTAGPAPSLCAGVSLSGGVNFIDWDSGTQTSNLVGADLVDGFTCLASVGDTGCGFEHQLESVYRALHDPPPENAGFLRDDALLVVVLITDEDDCSAPPDSDLFGNSFQQNQAYGPQLSFRCTQFGIQCNGTRLDGMSTQGPFSDCAPLTMAEGGKLFDTSRYIGLFANDRAHGGLKDDPNDIIVTSIAAAPAPVSTTIAYGMAGGCPPGFDQCGALAHSCVSTTDATFFGDPAVRIHDVLSNVAAHVETSVCDTDYSGVMDATGTTMGSLMRAGCLPGALPDTTHPECTVLAAGATLPACSASAPPCWSVVDDGTCPAEPGAYGNEQRERLVVQGVDATAPISATCTLLPMTVH